MWTKRYLEALLVSLLITGMITAVAKAGDLDDGISRFTDESINADDDMGKANINTSFIVVDAMGDAKANQYQAKKDGTTNQSSDSSENSNTNYNDGTGENNQNSIVLGAGTKANKVININIGK